MKFKGDVSNERYCHSCVSSSLHAILHFFFHAMALACFVLGISTYLPVDCRLESWSVILRHCSLNSSLVTVRGLSSGKN